MRADLASHWPKPARRVIYIFLWKRRSWAKPWGDMGGVASPSKNKPASLHNKRVCESVADRCQGRVFEILEFNVTGKIKKKTAKKRFFGLQKEATP